MIFIFAFMIYVYFGGQGFLTAQFAQKNLPASACRDFSSRFSNFSRGPIYRLPYLLTDNRVIKT